MMSDRARVLKDKRATPAITGDSNRLRAFRYEDAQDGIPPVTARVSRTSRQAISPIKAEHPTNRILPSPTSSFRTPSSHVAADVKRDSAFASSFSNATRSSYAESHHSSVAGGIAKEPNLPTIVVQDEELAWEFRSPGLPAHRSQSEERRVTRPGTASPSRIVRRSRSFQEIGASTPSCRLSDLELGDLASDRLEFSKRGSLLFGGKKMYTTGENVPIPALHDKGGTSIPAASTTQTATVPTVAADPTQPSDATRPGLQAGRRKPSMQMLQAASQGGRVLSAEETSFSMKVRSMYEYGDERAAQWTASLPERSSAAATANTSTSSVDASIDGVLASRPGDSPSIQHPAFREPTPDLRASYSKENTEVAGGIEDWDDVHGEDVDRYGFINPRARDAAPPGLSPPRNFNQSSRSVPPRSRDGTTIPGGSVRSFQSNRSSNRPHSSNIFRSRERRAVAGASDMLALPPGLEDIREQDDGSNDKAASQLKRRELTREQKWQKMARPVKGLQSTKGAGMQFTFDTTDPKLISRTWKGIPDRWRATAWHSFLLASALKRGIRTTDAELIANFHTLQSQSSADDVQIDMDVPRTINMHIMFRRRYRGGQRLLFHVLHAISLYFPKTGYVQGMASLAATLLCYYDEEHAFVMLVRLWQLRGLDTLYGDGFGGLMGALKQFETEWLAGGDVARQLEQLGIDPTAYGTRWYLTLFNMSVPFPAQLRIWDVFMLLGDAGPLEAKGNAFGGADLDVLHATSAALIDATREIVLESDFENAMKVLTSFVPVRDEDLLMRVAKAEWRMRKKRAPGIGGT